MKKFWFKRGLMILIFFIAAILLFAAIVMELWNAILPAVLGVQAITFIQAVGILLLSRILFGGFSRRGWYGGRHQQWRKTMQEKWSTMSPEEREKFKAEWKNRCGGRWTTDDKNTTAVAQQS